jgi:hypothetical protein
MKSQSKSLFKPYPCFPASPSGWFDSQPGCSAWPRSSGSAGDSEFISIKLCGEFNYKTKEIKIVAQI